MYIRTTKNFNFISLSEFKRHLKIDESDNTVNSEILAAVKAAFLHTEKRIGYNILPTVSTLVDYCFNGYCYRIFENDITLSGVTATDIHDLTTSITGFKVYSNYNSTDIRFSTLVQAERINIVYTSGYDPGSIPADLLHSVKILSREYFDNPDTYISNTLVASNAFERIIAPYVNLSI